MLVRVVLQSAVLQVRAMVQAYRGAHPNSPLGKKKSRVARAAREAANGLPKEAGKGSKEMLSRRRLIRQASKQAPNYNEGDEGNPDLEEEDDVADEAV